MAAAGRTAFLAVVTAIILFLTLWPAPSYSPGIDDDPVSVRQLADAVANILLFVPFGVAAALRLGSRTRTVGAAALLSLLIELLQLTVPGRYATPSDVVFNTIGGATGGALVWWFHDWAAPGPRSFLRGALPLVAATVALALIGGLPFLFEPAIPPHVLYGQWTAEFEDMAHYEGRVTAAFVGMMPVPSRRIAESGTLRHRLLGGESIRIQFIAGPPPPRLAPIFSIFDDRAEEMFLLGADGEDVVARFRTRARAFRLDERELRIKDALAGAAPGQLKAFRFRHEGRSYCLDVESRSFCGLGFTMGDTWGLLLFPIHAAAAFVAPYLWLAALAVPAGFWIRNDIALVLLGVALAATLALVPHWAGILPTPFPQFAAALTGAGLASLAGRYVQRRSHTRLAHIDDTVD